jgi:hypothetical protein
VLNDDQTGASRRLNNSLLVRDRDVSSKKRARALDSSAIGEANRLAT